MWGAGAASLGLFPPRLLPPSASLPYVGFLSKLPTELSSRGLPGAHREMGVGGGGKGVFLALLGNEVGATLRGFLVLEQGTCPPTWTVNAACAGFRLVHSGAGHQWAEEGMEGVRVGKKKGLNRPLPHSGGSPTLLPGHMAGRALPPRGRQQGSRLNPGHLQSGRGPGCLITESLKAFCV